MSLSFLLVLIIVLLTVLAFLTKRLEILKKSPSGGTTLNFKPLTVVIIAVIVAIAQPFDYDIVKVGNKGLLINLLGDKRGASNTSEVSGVVFYNKYSQELQEVPLDQRHIEYKTQQIVAKGGYPCDITPSFNYSVKEHGASNMFTNLRTTYKSGGLEAIEQGWLANAIIGAINDVANRYPIDYVFNNREKVEAEMVFEANKRAGKWFTISQLKSKIVPPDALRRSIEAKAKADADAKTAEAQALVAKADAQRKIELARGDSASVVISAKADAEAIRLKQTELSQNYIDYQRAIRWDGVLPSTVLGSGSNTLFNVK